MPRTNLAGSPQPAGLHISGRNEKKKIILTVATWNVRTMLDGDSRPERRTAIIAKELERYNIDIAALQETRIEGKGQIRESKYTIYWIGKTQGRRDAGVAFAVKNNIASRLSQLPTGISERIMSLRIPIGKERYLSLICVYAPTMTYSEDDKRSLLSRTDTNCEQCTQS